jgi:hypothetical protein
MWGMGLKNGRLFFIIVCLMLVISACSPQDDRVSDVKPDEAYQQWSHEVRSILEDKSYTLPAYDPTVGPLEMVYNTSEASFSFELYRSEAYGIRKGLSDLRTVHDLYYSFSHIDPKRMLSNSEIASRFGLEEKSSLSLSKYKRGDIQIYQLDGNDNGDRQQSILNFLEKRKINSAQILIFDLENNTNLEFHFMKEDHSEVISFSVQAIDELAKYLGDIGKD